MTVQSRASGVKLAIIILLEGLLLSIKLVPLDVQWTTICCQGSETE
jgi:hypothetical protein